MSQTFVRVQPFQKIEISRSDAFVFYMTGFVLLLLVLLSIRLGSYHLTMPELVSGLWYGFWQGGWQNLPTTDADSSGWVVLWEFRLPRLFCALLAGALFALSGFLLQGLTRNPLADPSLVGVSQGAALAVVIWLVSDLGQPEHRQWAALLGAFVSAALIQFLNEYRRIPSTLTFILLGIGMSLFLSALTSALLTYGDLDRVMNALSWLSGSVHLTDWRDVTTLSLWFSVLLPCSWALAHYLAVQQLGDVMAQGLGVPLRRIKRLQLFFAVSAAAMATAVVGPMAFIGLLAPHVARRLGVRLPHRQLLLSTMIGAVLVGSADLLGRTLWAPMQIPAGVLSTLIGAPAFLFLLVRTSRASSSSFRSKA